MDKKVLDRLQNLCAKRECCSQEIRRKALKLLDGDGAAADEIVASLEHDGFVDDARYAAAFAREKAQIAGWGPIKIRYALAAKGIKADEATFEGIDSGKSEDKLRKVLAAKWRTVAPDKLKLIRFALSRGYDYDTVRPLIEELSKL